MKNTLKALKHIDWTLAIGTIAVGAYLKDPLIAGVGVLGLVVAWYSPAERLKAYLQRRFLRKTTAPSDAARQSVDDAFYEQPGPAANETVAVAAAPRSFSSMLPAGQLYLHSSKHNVVRVHHLRFDSAQARRPWA